jgi:hypothetical protein
LVAFARSDSQDIFSAASTTMQDKLDDSFKQLLGKLEEISSYAVRAIQNHISVLLDKIIEPSVNPIKRENVEEIKVQMQQSIQTILLNWDVKWKMSYIMVADPEESKIPENYGGINGERRTHYDDDDVDMDMGTDTAF